MKWNGKWYGMEGEFWYGIWKMLRMEWKIVFPTSLPTTYTVPVYIKTYNKLRSTTRLE